HQAPRLDGKLMERLRRHNVTLSESQKNKLTIHISDLANVEQQFRETRERIWKHEKKALRSIGQVFIPRRAMVLAAGFATRLRPLTDTVPKPMVRVAGKPMIDTVIDRLVAIGVQEIVVNTHHLAEVIETHVGARKDVRIAFSREDEILETGGGIKKALPLLGSEPFYAIN